MLKFILTAAFATIILIVPLKGAQVEADSIIQKTATDSSKIIADTTAMVPADTTISDTSIISLPGKIEEADTVSTTIPAGTILVINFYKAVSTTYSSGATISQILDKDFTYGDKVIAPAGSFVSCKIIESRRGSKLTLSFTEIILNGKNISIKTETAGIEGENDKTARIVGQVFFSGGPFGGGTAGNRAPITGGLEGFKTGQKDIQIPSGTILKVPLKEDLVIKE
jgi:hypothetical protein